MRLSPSRVVMLAAAAVAVLAVGVLPAHADTMPQFDVANPLLKAQVIWGAIIFAVLYVALSRIGLPAVAGVLAARERTIGGDLEQARLAKETADRAVAELTEARRRAYAEAQAALAEATQLAAASAAAKSAEVNARLEHQLADSKAQIAAARANAMSALRGVATETAAAVITRLVGHPADPARVGTAVAESLGARGLADA